jgi:hypothetical protein
MCVPSSRRISYVFCNPTFGELEKPITDRGTVSLPHIEAWVCNVTIGYLLTIPQ